MFDGHAVCIPRILFVRCNSGSGESDAAAGGADRGPSLERAGPSRGRDARRHPGQGGAAASHPGQGGAAASPRLASRLAVAASRPTGHDAGHLVSPHLAIRHLASRDAGISRRSIPTASRNAKRARISRHLARISRSCDAKRCRHCDTDAILDAYVRYRPAMHALRCISCDPRSAMPGR